MGVVFGPNLGWRARLTARGARDFTFCQRGIRRVIQTAAYLYILSECFSLSLRGVVLFDSALCACALSAFTASASLAFKLHLGICCHFISLVPFRRTAIGVHHYCPPITRADVKLIAILGRQL